MSELSDIRADLKSQGWLLYRLVYTKDLVTATVLEDANTLHSAIATGGTLEEAIAAVKLSVGLA